MIAWQYRLYLHLFAPTPTRISPSVKRSPWSLVKVLAIAMSPLTTDELRSEPRTKSHSEKFRVSVLVAFHEIDSELIRIWHRKLNKLFAYVKLSIFYRTIQPLIHPRTFPSCHHRACHSRFLTIHHVSIEAHLSNCLVLAVVFPFSYPTGNKGDK